MKLSGYLKKKDFKFAYVFTDGDIIATKEIPVALNPIDFDNNAQFSHIILSKMDTCDLPLGKWSAIQ